MVLRTIHVFFFSLCMTLCMGQERYTPPKIPPKYENELKEAMHMAQGGQIDEAIKEIKSIIDRFPEWTSAHQELGRIYFKTGRKQEAIAQLETSLAIDTLSQLEILYTLGRIYEDVSEPAKAVDCYQAVMEKAVHDQGLTDRATVSKQALEKKKNLWDNEFTIRFNSFDTDINTPQHESLGRWSLDGQQMVFTRLVFDQEDIFFASFDSTAGLWRIEEFTYNSPQNEGAHALSPDGKYLIFTSCNRQDGLGSCDLYLSFKEKEQWTRPTNMGPAFNSNSWDGQPCFGLDGLSLFFSSSRPGGIGGRDIWYVYQLAAGKWSNPINAGATINTPDDEESPFVHFDGQTIYFMRNGKHGLGGYDLYMARKELSGKWTTAENLGSPINSGADEGALTLHPGGTKAIITRMTDEAKNDLFEFELPEKFRSSPLQALRVNIKDYLTGLPVRARLELFEVNALDTIRVSQWADNDGNLSVATQRNINYGAMAVADGYIMYSANLEADTSASRTLNIRMIALETAADKVIVLQNVFFETGSAALLPTSESELNKLLWTLRKNTEMKIEIRGHTDNEGDEKSNQELSEERAKSVYEYLTGRGIDAGRLSFVGFGESQPVADNSTKEGRKQNRRTEFKVTSE